MKEYALYKGEEMLGIGTMKEIAEQLGVHEQTIYFYGTNAYKKRLKQRRVEKKGARVLVSLDD